jgi:hypothetical protein
MNLDYTHLATQAARRSGLTSAQLERAASGHMMLGLRTPMPLYRVETYHVPWLERWRVWWRNIKNSRGEQWIIETS